MPFSLGFDGVGVLFIFVFVFWLVPLALGAWALITLARLRTGQQEMLSRMAALERRLGGHS